jgi:YesN/AraC family two-component response regulator
MEDDDQMRTIIRKMLERAGYKVLEAPDGNVGIRLFRENPVDLVITDIIMPEKEGIETILELKRDFPETKVIAISGGGRGAPKEYLKIAKKLGVQRTLAKPFEKEDLLRAVKELLT